MKTLIFFTFIISVLMIYFFITPQYVYSVPESLTISTDKTSYHYGDNYTISGRVNPVVPNQVVSIVILSPNYPHPASLSTTPNSNGSYSYTLPLVIKDISSGNFTVIARYGLVKNQTTFSYNGPPCMQQNNYWYDGVHSAPASNPRIVDSFGNAITGPVKPGQQIQVTSDLANGQNCDQAFAYIVQIQDLNGVTISLSWITGTLPAGQSLNPAQSWTPITAGVYTVQIFTWQSLDNPNALAPPLTTTISVEGNATLAQPSHTVSEISSNPVPGSPTILNSPLRQLESGIAAKDLTCAQGLQLIFKFEDSSPACVTPDTSGILVKRGWTYDNMILSKNMQHIVILPSNDTENQTVKVVEIKMVPPYTPGGPVIQLTIQNIGIEPITHLDAILETNHNYTFSFQSVTSSTPLILGNSVSNTTMLVGGGFQTESTYSLIINGIKDNIPFGYFEKVQIQG